MPGHLEGFKEAVEKAVRFVEEHGPQLMVEVFIDEAQMLAYSYQLYSDSESVLKHWQLSDPYIQGVMQHCTVEAFDVYGEPDEAVMQGLRSGGNEQMPVTFTPWFTGFYRLGGKQG